MSRARQRAVTPIWAQQIEAIRDGDSILVRGWGHSPIHLDMRMVTAEQITKLDVLEQFRRDTLRHLSDTSGSTHAGIYQFVDANDDQKLLAFVEKFGPIWGGVLRSQTDGLFKAQIITVQQKFPDLRRQQAIFAAAVQLLKQLNLNNHADPKEMVLAMMGIWPVPEGFMPNSSWWKRTRQASKAKLPKAITKLVVPTRPGMTLDEECPWVWTMLAVHELAYGKEDGKLERIMEYGHRTLCQLLNAFPPVLVPIEGRQPLEMPAIAAEGIRSVLYFKLRLDYLAGRVLGTCQNCGGHFLILKRGARACSESCRRTLRNQRYWNRNKKAINRKRRAHRT